MRGRVVHRQAAGLGDHHDEEGGESQQVSGRQGHLRIGPEALDDATEVDGAGAHGEREHGHDDGRLGQRRHRDLAASAHAAEGAAGVEAGQGEKERPDQEQVHEDDDVAGESENGPADHERHDQRARQHGGGQDHRRDGEDPRGGRRHDAILAQELSQVGIRLPRVRAPAADQTGLQRAHDSSQERRAKADQRELDDGNQDVGDHANTSRASRASRM